jgi:anti-anti-sigma regulatory factor
MLRITPITYTQDETILKIEGRLDHSNMQLLEREMQQRSQSTECLVLELKGLKHIDRESITMLKQWPGKQLILRGGTMFVRALLTTHGLA